jgi:hypothetical protein
LKSRRMRAVSDEIKWEEMSKKYERTKDDAFD